MEVSIYTLGGFFLAFQLGLIGFGLSLLVIPNGYAFFLANSVVGALSHLILVFSVLDILCKNIPLKIRMIYEAKKK